MSPSATKIRRLIQHLDDRGEIQNIIKRLRSRAEELCEKERAARAAKAWEAMDKVGLGSFWRLTDGWVHHGQLRIGLRYKLVELYRGRKHVGAWLECDGRKVWLPATSADDVRLWTEADDAAAPDLAERRKSNEAMMGRINQAIASH